MPKERTLAQGTLYLVISQVILIISSYAMHSALGRLLNPDNYGIFGLILSILVWLEIFFGGLTGALIKTVAEYPEYTSIIEKLSVRLLMLVSSIVFIIGFFLAPLMANLFNEPSVTFYLRIAIIDIPIIALYKGYIGLLNGRRFYDRQAISAISYSLTRVTFVVGLVLLGFSIAGAFVGNIIASVIGFIVAFLLLHAAMRGEQAEKNEATAVGITISYLLKLSIPFIIISLLYNLLIYMDLWLVQGLLADTTTTGYYVAALNLAKALYFVFMALSAALFPAIAGSIARDDEQLTKRYINRALRFLLIFLLPIAMIMAVSSTGLVTLIFSSEYATAGTALAILAFAYSLFSINLAYISILLANNNFKETILLVIFLVLLDIILCVFLIPRYEMTGAAMSTLITSASGFLLASAIIWRRFRVIIELAFFLKILSSSILVSAIFLIPAQGLFLIFLYFTAAVLYTLFLRIFGEWDTFRELKT